MTEWAPLKTVKGSLKKLHQHHRTGFKCSSGPVSSSNSGDKGSEAAWAESGTCGQADDCRGILTWISANELRPRALLGLLGGGVGGANQLVLGHLGVGLGKFQPQGLGDFWIKPDPLRSKRNTCEVAFIYLYHIYLVI